jgi:hypothetical protein
VPAGDSPSDGAGDKYKDKGLEVIGLTIENKASDLDAVNSFIKEFKINYPIGWAKADVRGHHGRTRRNSANSGDRERWKQSRSISLV